MGSASGWRITHRTRPELRWLSRRSRVPISRMFSNGIGSALTSELSPTETTNLSLRYAKANCVG